MKYRTHETDFGALARELHGDKDDDAEELDSGGPDDWSDSADRNRD